LASRGLAIATIAKFISEIWIFRCDPTKEFSISCGRDFSDRVKPHLLSASRTAFAGSAAGPEKQQPFAEQKKSDSTHASDKKDDRTPLLHFQISKVGEVGFRHAAKVGRNFADLIGREVEIAALLNGVVVKDGEVHFPDMGILQNDVSDDIVKRGEFGWGPFQSPHIESCRCGPCDLLSDYVLVPGTKIYS